MLELFCFGTVDTSLVPVQANRTSHPIKQPHISSTDEAVIPSSVDVDVRNSTTKRRTSSFHQTTTHIILVNTRQQLSIRYSTHHKHNFQP